MKPETTNQKLMKASTYEIAGCRGSQSYRLTGDFETIRAARAAARRDNQSNADGLGLSFRDYEKRSGFDEGWTVALKRGLDDYKTGR